MLVLGVVVVLMISFLPFVLFNLPFGVASKRVTRAGRLGGEQGGVTGGVSALSNTGRSVATEDMTEETPPGATPCGFSPTARPWAHWATPKGKLNALRAKGRGGAQQHASPPTLRAASAPERSDYCYRAKRTT